MEIIKTVDQFYYFVDLGLYGKAFSRFWSTVDVHLCLICDAPVLLQVVNYTRSEVYD